MDLRNKPTFSNLKISIYESCINANNQHNYKVMPICKYYSREYRNTWPVIDTLPHNRLSILAKPTVWAFWLHIAHGRPMLLCNFKRIQIPWTVCYTQKCRPWSASKIAFGHPSERLGHILDNPSKHKLPLWLCVKHVSPRLTHHSLKAILSTKKVSSQPSSYCNA